jgi:hypothetical protein
MTTLLLLLGAGAAFGVMAWLLRRAWKRDAYFELLFFIDRAPGTVGTETVIWLRERLASNAGYHVPQLSLASSEGQQQRVLYTGADRERLVMIGECGPWVWWWSSRQGLHARDRWTGALAYDEHALLERMPQLRGKLVDRTTFRACDGYALDTTGLGVRVRTNDAQAWVFNDALEAMPSREAWVEVRYPDDSDDRESVVQEGALTDGRRLALWGKDRRRPHLDKRPLEGADFLDGHLIWDGSRGRALELEGPASVLVAHRDKLGQGANLLISRLSLDGTCVWTRSEAELGVARNRLRERGEVAFAAARPDGLYIVVNRVPYALRVLDPATGALRRRIPPA